MDEQNNYVLDDMYSEKNNFKSLIFENPLSDKKEDEYTINLRSLSDREGIILETGYSGYPDYTNNFILDFDMIDKLIDSLNAIKENSTKLHNIIEVSNNTINTIKDYIENKHVIAIHITPILITTLDIGVELFGRILFKVLVTYRETNSIKSKVNTYSDMVLSEAIHSKEDYTRLFKLNTKILNDKGINIDFVYNDKLKSMCNTILNTIDPKLEKIK